jgi:DNA-nicking Smr family endonuclease
MVGDPPPEEDFNADDPVELPIEDEIDLHTFSPRDIRVIVQEYCREAAERGFEEVRLIHGKGKGVQRRIVQSELAKHPNVAEFWDAPPGRGHWGATLARLRVDL